jgi:hypothetical protein
MKQKLIILVILAAATLGGLLWLQDYLSYRSITIVLNSPATGVVIKAGASHEGETQKEITITSNQTIRLKEGSYIYTPQGKDANTSVNSFTVTKNDTLTIAPAYSLEYRKKLVPKIKPQLEDALRAQYPTAMASYQINNVTLMANADWAGVLLTSRTATDSNPGVIYRAIIKKKDSSWEVVSKPQVVLTVYNTPSVDRSLLQATNKLGLQ